MSEQPRKTDQQRDSTEPKVSQTDEPVYRDLEPDEEEKALVKGGTAPHR